MKLHDFFYYNKSDRNAILALLTIAVVSLLAFFVLGNEDVSVGEGYQRTAQPTTKKYAGNKPTLYYKTEEKTAELFPFDPNTADSTAFLRLGLQPWQVRNIYKYRAKGGIYRCPADFARLYGLTQQRYLQLKPYIRISQDYLPASLLPEAQARKARHDSIVAHYTPKMKEGETLDLNTADTTQLQQVPGIGPYYARQILSYRKRLGGFANGRQLMEIDDFPAESLKYFTVNPTHITKLNVNQLTLSQLRHHPYFGFYQARDIVDYRRLRGPLKSLDDLKLMKSFTPETIERLRPYVEF